MTNPDEQNARDFLDQAIDALRRSPMADKPSDLAGSTVKRLAAADGSSEFVQFQNRRRRMFRIAGFSTAAAAAVILVIGSVSILLLGSGASYAFADVIENVKKAKAVIFNLKSKIGSGPEMELTWYLQGDRIRMELGQFQTKIADLKKGKGLDLIPRLKTASFIPIGKRVAAAFDNPISQLRRLRPKDAKKVGQEQHNGKLVDVYLVNRIDLFGMRGEGEMRIWVDPKTQLPVRLRMACNTRKGAKGKPYDTFLTIENISWHESLDPGLFSLTVPKGYTLQPAKKK